MINLVWKTLDYKNKHNTGVGQSRLTVVPTEKRLAGNDYYNSFITSKECHSHGKSTFVHPEYPLFVGLLRALNELTELTLNLQQCEGAAIFDRLL